MNISMDIRPDGAVRLVVADNGIGLPASEDPHMEPKTLGLRLVTDLARQLDGSVAISNAQGTCIQVDFSRID
jgi:two-component sensor histidine kinase